MAAGDVYRLVCQWRVAGTANLIVNGFTYRAQSGTILQTQEEDLVAAFKATVETEYNDIVHSTLTLEKYSVIPKPGGAVTYEEIASATGQQVGDCLPYQTSALISWKTGIPGRSNRGRTYLPPANEGSQAGGVLVAAYVTAIEEFADAALQVGDGITTDIYDLGVWSERLSQFRPVTSYVINPVMATQRGRRS